MSGSLTGIPGAPYNMVSNTNVKFYINAWANGICVIFSMRILLKERMCGTLYAIMVLP